MTGRPFSSRGERTRRLTSSGATLEARAVPMYPSTPYSITASSPVLTSRTTHERSSASKSKAARPFEPRELRELPAETLSSKKAFASASLTSPVSRSASRTVLGVRATTYRSRLTVTESNAISRPVFVRKSVFASSRVRVTENAAWLVNVTSNASPARVFSLRRRAHAS